MLKILITAIGSSNGRAIAKILNDRFPKISIYATDSNDLSTLTPIAYISKYFRVPLAKSPDFVDKLLDICDQYQIKFILPIFDDEVIQIAHRKDAFNEVGTKVFLSDAKLLEICRDKFKLFQHGSRLQLPVIASSEDPDFDYPMFLKPRAGNGSKDCFKIFNKEEAVVLSKRVQDPMFQKFIEGRILDIDFVTDAHSNLVCAVIKEELETKNGIGVKIKIQNLPFVLEELAIILKRLEYQGIGAIEFFLTPENKLFIIEINIRPSSGIIYTYKAGLDILSHFLFHAGYTHIIPQDQPIRFGSKMNRELVVFELD